MNKLVMAIVFVVVTGGMFFVCANSHIDFFPCTITSRDGDGPLRTEEGTCGLLENNREDRDGQHERLTAVGWALLTAFCGGIGLVSGLVAGALTRKRR